MVLYGALGRTVYQRVRSRQAQCGRACHVSHTAGDVPVTATAAVLLALFGIACGGASSPSAPMAVAAAPGFGVGAGTVLSLSAAENGHAPSSANVLVGGRTYTADGAGRVVLDQNISAGTPMDILATGMLDRQTLLRSPGATAFTLWPRSSATGLDEDYTRRLVYSWGEDGNPGHSPLYRLSGAQAVLVPSPVLQADPAAMAAHRRAADEASAAVGGAVRYTVAADPPPGAIVFTTTLDPEDAGCNERVLAFTSIRLRAGEIASGSIVFCTPGAARDGSVVHEVGHTFGMGHSPDADEVMHAYKLLRQPDAFGGREALVMRLMLQRRGGNRFPDNDRQVAAAGSGEVTIACPR
jgi:hypothetical protein